MIATRISSHSIAFLALALSLGGAAWAQSTVPVPVTPKAKPQATQRQAAQPVPARQTEGLVGSILSFDPLTNLFRARRAPLVDHLTYQELERDRFGGDTIDPSGRYDSFFTAPEIRPTQRLGQYTR